MRSPENISPARKNDKSSLGNEDSQLVPSRYVTVELAARLTGYTVRAIELKIAKGVWQAGRQWVKRDGRVLIDLTGVEFWHRTGTP